MSPSDGARVGQEGFEAQPGAQGRYRVGRSLGRTLYRDDELIGLLDDRDVAKHIVDVLNHFDVMQGIVAQASRERDEAIQEADAAGRVAERAIADATRVKRERDEARRVVFAVGRLLAEVGKRAPHAMKAAAEALEAGSGT